MTAVLEHANLTVSDPLATAAWMETVFGWRIRWQGPAKGDGFTVHIGEETTYLALFRPREDLHPLTTDTFATRGAMNHVGVTVSDLDATEKKVLAEGFETYFHDDYEPGRRFYFRDQDRIEFEVACYT